MSSLDVVVGSLEKSGIKPQFKRKLDDGSLVDADVSYLDLLNSQVRLANTAQSIDGASETEKTIWAIQMKDFANGLYYHGRYHEASEKYLESLTAANFSSDINTLSDNNVDSLIVPILCNLAACSMKLQEWRKTMRFCEEALKLRSQTFKAVIRFSKAAIQLGEYDIALEKLKTYSISKITDQSSESYVNDDSSTLTEKQQIESLVKLAHRGIYEESKSVRQQKKALSKAFNRSKQKPSPLLSPGKPISSIGKVPSSPKQNWLISILRSILVFYEAMINFFLALFGVVKLGKK